MPTPDHTDTTSGRSTDQLGLAGSPRPTRSWGQRWESPTASAIAPGGPPGPERLAPLDGTGLDAADTPANAARFGNDTDRSAFPKSGRRPSAGEAPTPPPARRPAPGPPARGPGTAGGESVEPPVGALADGPCTALPFAARPRRVTEDALIAAARAGVEAKRYLRGPGAVRSSRSHPCSKRGCGGCRPVARCGR
ncbi:hypothetical protein [Nocardiopsis sp. CNT312]|uniref:hypothetical protein n=1 Tax=Nocardiopsis sp. CNT312 TaxID=1137268 RepID=UPI00049017E1|nr:hypothetical protein [Nocardiopsis sp. CNT312]